jgi:hypothetical protein
MKQTKTRFSALRPSHYVGPCFALMSAALFVAEPVPIVAPSSHIHALPIVLVVQLMGIDAQFMPLAEPVYFEHIT